uniref:Uncharacterized protein n=1 Tax=Triticum urartu TaxID=4572 RepID=A0A8R7UTQ3_TRIUA
LLPENVSARLQCRTAGRPVLHGQLRRRRCRILARLPEQGLLPLGDRRLGNEEVGDVPERHPPPRPPEPLQLAAPDGYYAMRTGGGGGGRRQILLVGAVNCHLGEEKCCLPL